MAASASPGGSLSTARQGGTFLAFVGTDTDKRLPTMLRPSFAKRFAVTFGAIAALTACGSAALLHEEERLTFRVVRETPGWFQGLPDGVREFDLRVSDAP